MMIIVQGIGREWNYKEAIFYISLQLIYYSSEVDGDKPRCIL